MTSTLTRLGSISVVAAAAVGAQAINLATWNFGASTTTLDLAAAAAYSDTLTAKSLVTHTGGSGASETVNAVGTLTHAAGVDTAGRALGFKRQRSATVTTHSLFFDIAKGGHASLNVDAVRFAAVKGANGPIAWTLFANVNGAGFGSVGTGSVTGSYVALGVTGLNYTGVQTAAFELRYSSFTSQGSSTVDTDNVRIEGTAAPVPEPFTMVLGAAGLGLAAMRRRSLKFA